MAYDSRYRVGWIIASMTTAIVAAIQYADETFSSWSESIAYNFHAIDWPDFIPTARESIALDVAARELVDHRQPGIVSRFAEFVRRALAHDEYSAGHFDPGRMPA